ncbi:MAG TPA: hypothetical protein PKA88_04335, partial [Polyangiaceae bacterium]|nr:hypothetical protein [Polyangiaceae bacterium]
SVERAAPAAARPEPKAEPAAPKEAVAEKSASAKRGAGPPAPVVPALGKARGKKKRAKRS